MEFKVIFVININKLEKSFLWLIRRIKGINKCPNIIYKTSKFKYGHKDNLARFWFLKYKNREIGKYTYGYKYLDYPSIRKNRFIYIHCKWFSYCT